MEDLNLGKVVLSEVMGKACEDTAEFWSENQEAFEEIAQKQPKKVLKYG